MATVSFTIADADLTRYVDAFAANYDVAVHGGTKNAYAKAQAALYLKNFVINYERSKTAPADIDIT